MSKQVSIWHRRPAHPSTPAAGLMDSATILQNASPLVKDGRCDCGHKFKLSCLSSWQLVDRTGRTWTDHLSCLRPNHLEHWLRCAELYLTILDSEKQIASRFPPFCFRNVPEHIWITGPGLLGLMALLKCVYMNVNKRTGALHNMQRNPSKCVQNWNVIRVRMTRNTHHTPQCCLSYKILH